MGRAELSRTNLAYMRTNNKQALDTETAISPQSPAACFVSALQCVLDMDRGSALHPHLQQWLCDSVSRFADRLQSHSAFLYQSSWLWS